MFLFVALGIFAVWWNGRRLKKRLEIVDRYLEAQEATLAWMRKHPCCSLNHPQAQKLLLTEHRAYKAYRLINPAFQNEFTERYLLPKVNS